MEERHFFVPSVLFIWTLLMIGVFGNICHGQGTGSIDRLPACPGNGVTAALMDSSGVLWMATQGQGLYRLQPGENEWKKEEKSDNFPDTDNFYSLAEDLQGRIWAGTDRCGVCIWNGEQWKQYTGETTLPGERVFDISVSPVTGDVAVATSGGIAIYAPSSDTWMDVTRVDGLAEDQAVALSFDTSGNLWAAFHSMGIAKTTLQDNYKKWDLIQAKWHWDPSRRLSQPPAFSGEGLPANFCNALAVHGQSVLVGTVCGLGIHRNDIQRFLRGKDAAEKIRQLTGRAIDQGRLKLPPLPEDYVASLHPVKEGVWIGFRKRGAVLLDPSTMRYKVPTATASSPDKKEHPVTCFASLHDGRVLAGIFGEGLRVIGKTAETKKQEPLLKKGTKHPVVQTAPNEDQWNNLLASFQSLPDTGSNYGACFAGEDWATQGDLHNRYGRHYALICSASQYVNYPDLSFRFNYEKGGKKGVYSARGLVVFGNKIEKTRPVKKYYGDHGESRTLLYDIDNATRPVAEWSSDEVGWHDAVSNGADLWAVVRVPEGKQEISLYFNQPGPDQVMRYDRDYLIEVRYVEFRLPKENFIWRNYFKGSKIPEDEMNKELNRILSLPVLARARSRDFGHSGVYKNFYSDCPGYYFFRILRNYSKETTLGGIFLSKSLERDYQDKTMPSPPEMIAIKMDSVPRNLLNAWSVASIKKADTPAHAGYSRLIRLYSFRKALMDASVPEALKINWRWHLNIWNESDMKTYKEKMLAVWTDQQKDSNERRSSDKYPNSPNVINFTPKEIRLMNKWKVDWRQFIPGSAQYDKNKENEMRRRIEDHFANNK